jgi:hypothetical protein
MKYWRAYKVSLLVHVATLVFSWITVVVTVAFLFSHVANIVGYRDYTLEQKATACYGFTWLLTGLFVSWLLGILIINPIDERRIGIIGGILTVFFWHLIIFLFVLVGGALLVATSSLGLSGRAMTIVGGAVLFGCLAQMIACRKKRIKSKFEHRYKENHG